MKSITMMSLTALLTVTIFTAAQQALAQQEERPWEGPATLCGVSFRIFKSEWVILSDAPQPGSKTCSGKVRSHIYKKLNGPEVPDHFYELRIDVYPQPLEELMELLEIRQEGDRWFVGEGSRAQPVYQITGPAWWGLRVDHYSFRTYLTNPQGDGYSAETDGIWVVISSKTSKRTAVILTVQGADDGPLQLLLNTFEFDKTL